MNKALQKGDFGEPLINELENGLLFQTSSFEDVKCTFAKNRVFAIKMTYHFRDDF